MAKAYVFDLDGTLVTLHVDWGRVKEELQKITGPVELTSVFPAIAEVVSRRPELRRRVFETIDRYELEALPLARLHAGSKELLARLSETAKVCLVTLQGERACSAILERFELGQYFIQSFTREDAMDRAEQVKLALARMRVDPASGMFVGDRFNDLNAAKRAGVPFTLVRTHGEDPEEEGVNLYHSIEEFTRSLGF